MWDQENNYFIKTDLKGNYTYVNSYFVNTFSHLESNFIGKNSLQSIYFEDAHLVVHAVSNLLNGKSKKECMNVRKPNTKTNHLWTYWEFFIEYNKLNEAIGILCFGIDITESIEKNNSKIDFMQAYIQNNFFKN